MAQNQESSPFIYKFHKGCSTKYKLSVEGTVEVETPDGSKTNPIRIEMIILQTVIETNNDSATISIDFSSVKALDGKESAALPEEGRRTVSIMDKKGNVNYLSGNGPWQGTDFSQMIFPDHPLKTGESWTQEMPTKPGTFLTANTRYTFKGYKKIGPFNGAEFEAKMNFKPEKGIQGKPSAAGKGVIYFDPDLGQIIKVDIFSRFSFNIPVPDGSGKTANTSTAIHTEMELINQ